MSAWWIYVPGVLIVLGWLVTFRWLDRLQSTVDALRERLARLEGREGGPKH